MQARSSQSLVDYIALMLGAVLLVVLFLACFQLLQLRETRSPTLSVPSTSFDDLRWSREAMTMGCVLLGGLVGGYLQYMRERFNELMPEPVDSQDESLETSRSTTPRSTAPLSIQGSAWFAFFSQLLMGFGAASVFAIFIPLAIAASPELRFFNPWGLLMLAVGAGYLSRNMFGGIQAKVERLFNELRDIPLRDSGEISSAVKAGVLEALAPPPAVNFAGTVSLDVVDASGKSCVRQGDVGPYVELRIGDQYEARAEFRPSEGSGAEQPSPTPALQPLQIDGGVESAMVPFELRIELPFLSGVRPMERAVEVARSFNDRVGFGFTVPEKLDMQEAGSSRPQVPAEASREIVVFVYQKSVFCAVVSLAVRWATL